VQRRTIFRCANPHCPSPDPVEFTDQQVDARIAIGKTDIICPVCGETTTLLETRPDPATAEELKKRLAAMNRQADEERRTQSAASMLSGKQATGNFDVYIYAHPREQTQVDYVVQQLQSQGIYTWQPAESPNANTVAEQVKSVAFFIGDHGLTGETLASMHNLAERYIQIGRPVIFVLYQVDTAPEELMRSFRRTAEWIFLTSLDDDNDLDNLARLITGRDPN
jgi:hypothetical protein